MDGHQIHDILGGWLQPLQHCMPLGRVQSHLQCLILMVPGTVAEDKPVRWGRRVAPGDVDTGRSHMGEMQVRDGAEACGVEEGRL